MSSREPFVIPPGAPLSLRTWAEVATGYVRKYLPEVRAVQAGPDIVWRYAGRSATLSIKRATWWLRFRDIADSRTPTLAHIHLERRDEFVAKSVASTLIGYFDSAFCTSESQRRA